MPFGSPLVKTAGEFELISAFIAELPHPRAPHGPGDDAAVVASETGKLCLTTDAVVDGVHFTRPGFSLGDVGHKALAVNLSDLAAMGARPTWWLCALGLPKSFDRAQVRALARGMAPLARRHRLQLVGGNITASPVLTLTLTLAGQSKRPLLRSGARRGDLLFVSGVLGAAAAGLSRSKNARARGPLEQAQRRPTPQVELGQVAASFATAAIDVSDGLLADLGHLCAASGVGADLDSNRIPIHPALAEVAPKQALAWALGGGEDYQLLLAVPPRRAAGLIRAAKKTGVRLSQIGAIRAGSGVSLDGTSVTAAGFNHFRR